MKKSTGLKPVSGSAKLPPDAQAEVPATFHQQRKQDSRERLLAAAVESFGETGYYPVSVEEICSRAGVSRMTFYRNFRSKGDIASELYDRAGAQQLPHLLRIRDLDWRDRRVVHAWLQHIFEADRADRLLQQVFIQVSAVDADFTQQAHEQIAKMIHSLGKKIPAFSLRAKHPDDRRRWLQAWLLIYEILDQGNHAALDSGVAADPLTLDILADRFLAFVGT